MIGFMRFLSLWLPPLGLAAIIFFQSSYASPAALPRWPYLDKFMHAGVYGLLSALICRALGSLPRWHGRSWRLIAAATILTALYGLSDEWHQAYVPSRSSEAADVLADLAGGFAGALFYQKLFLHWKRRRAHAA